MKWVADFSSLESATDEEEVVLGIIGDQNDSEFLHRTGQSVAAKNNGKAGASGNGVLAYLEHPKPGAKTRALILIPHFLTLPLLLFCFGIKTIGGRKDWVITLLAGERDYCPMKLAGGDGGSRKPVIFP
jgi:hypothetical protein